MRINNFSNKLLVLFLFSISFVYSQKNQNNQLIIFHAGSLTVPINEIITEFKKENPKVTVLKEIAGSRECARKISELKKECDIFFSADYKVIEDLLIPDHAKWSIKFAVNEMTIVYTGKSKHSSKINKNNWFEILQNEDVRFGRSDPNSDPCGYRTILSLKLADKFYKEKNISEKLLRKDNEYIRPKEVDLLALLETGELDYIFLYRSVAEQHGLKYLILPDEINLKSTEMIDYYSSVTVELTGKIPGEKIIVYGEPMVYGFTIPGNAPNNNLAYKFIHFTLDKNKGIKILEKNGQPTIIPSSSDTYKFIPDELKKYAKAGD